MTPVHSSWLNNSERSSTGQLLAYAQLCRLPNLFTAVANVAMGFLVTNGSLRPGSWFALLTVASCCLYLAGMVLNDVFDAEVDARERPQRPIPAGRISWRTAQSLGYALCATGVLAACLVSYLSGTGRPALVGVLLAGCVLAYDRGLKATWLGPISMGACRLLNVMLGMSVATVPSTGMPRSWSGAEWLIAIGVGVYVVGITVFARSEAVESRRPTLVSGLTVMLAGLALLASLGTWGQVPGQVALGRPSWWLLWAVLGLTAARRGVLAILDPSPQRVQHVVANAIHSMVFVDALLTFGFCGVYWGWAVLLLLVPTLVLRQWIYST